MLFRMVISKLEPKEHDYLISQYKLRKCSISSQDSTSLIIEADDTFEQSMMLMAIGMHFTDYTVTLISKGGGGLVKEET